MIFPWSKRRKVSRVSKHDPDLDLGYYDWCENNGGHLVVDCFESWFCLRCWVGFFMGMSFGVPQEERQSIISGKGSYLLTVFDQKKLRMQKVWNPTGKGELSTLDSGGVVYLYNKSGHTETLISYEDAIKRPPDVLSHKKGGPPHVLVLR